MNLREMIAQENKQNSTPVYENLKKIETFLEELKKTHPEQVQACAEIFDFSATEFEALKDFFDQTNLLNLRFYERNILLLFAVYAGKTEVIRFLINKMKVDPNFLTFPGLTPLLVATSLKIRKLLLELGATRNRLLLWEARHFGGDKFWNQQVLREKYPEGFSNWIDFLLQQESSIGDINFLEESVFDLISWRYDYDGKKKEISKAHSQVLIKFIELGTPEITGIPKFISSLVSYKDVFVRNPTLDSSDINHNESLRKAIVNWALAQQKMTVSLKILINFFINQLAGEAVTEIISGRKSTSILYNNIKKMEEFLEKLATENIKNSCKTLFDDVLKNFKSYVIFFCEEIKDPQDLLLLLAIAQGNSELVKGLITSLNANPNLLTDNGISPLLVATSNEMRNLLLTWGAKLKDDQLAKECSEWQGYHFSLEQKFVASEKFFSEWVNFLTNHTSVIATDDKKKTAAYYLLAQYYPYYWQADSRERPKLKDLPEHLYKPKIEKIERLLAALVTVGALNNGEDVDAMVNYVFEYEAFFPDTGQRHTRTFILAPSLATAIVEWVKSQTAITLPQKKLAILYSTALSGKLTAEMWRLPCADEKIYIKELRQYAPLKKDSPYKFDEEISPKFLPVFQDIDNLLRNRTLCLELFEELETDLKNKCGEVPKEDFDSVVLNRVWPIPSARLENNNTKAELNSSLLPKERKYKINLDPRSPAYFANFVATKFANIIVANEKKLFKEFKYGGNSFTHGEDAHRLMWHIIMRGEEEGIVKLGRISLTAILEESVKIWGTFFDGLEDRGYGSPYDLCSSLLDSTEKLPTLSYLLRVKHNNGLIKLAGYQSEKPKTPEAILTLADWQGRYFIPVVKKVPDVKEHYKERPYFIDIDEAKTTDTGLVFYKIKFASDISAHAQYIIKNYYKPDLEKHEGQHVSRVGMNVVIFTNFYRKWQDNEALAITPYLLKVMIIAGFFHDSGRLNDGVDVWDLQSAIKCYFYLIKLGVDPKIAREMAEYVANKDSTDKYFKLIVSDGKVSWEEIPSTSEKNIYQKIFQCADCGDMHRAVGLFLATYLDCYKDLAQSNKQALREMAEIVAELRTLIAIQGDLYGREDEKIKSEYKNAENCFIKVISDVTNNPTKFPVLSKLYNNNTLLSKEELEHFTLIDAQPLDPNLGVTREFLQHEMKAGRVFVRSIPMPSALEGQQTKIAIELKKTYREGGNPDRSVSMFYRSPTYGNSGFLILNPKISQIRYVSNIDAGTGRKNKIHLLNTKKKTVTQEDLDQLLEDLILGRSHTEFNFGQGKILESEHCEILYDIDAYDGLICFSNEPCLFNEHILNRKLPFHRYTPLLEAKYDQNEHQKRGIELPLVELFRIAPYFEKREFTTEQIIGMWQEACTDYIKNNLNHNINVILNASIDELKILSLYGTLQSDYAAKSLPLDANYTEAQQEEINKIITTLKNKLLDEYYQSLFNSLRADPQSTQTESVFSESVLIALYYYPGELPDHIVSLFFSVISNQKDKIISYIKNEFTIDHLYNICIPSCEMNGFGGSKDTSKVPLEQLKHCAKKIMQAFRNKETPSSIHEFENIALLCNLATRLNFSGMQEIKKHAMAEINKMQFAIPYSSSGSGPNSRYIDTNFFPALIILSNAFGCLDELVKYFERNFISELNDIHFDYLPNLKSLKSFEEFGMLNNQLIEFLNDRVKKYDFSHFKNQWYSADFIYKYVKLAKELNVFSDEIKVKAADFLLSTDYNIRKNDLNRYIAPTMALLEIPDPKEMERVLNKVISAYCAGVGGYYDSKKRSNLSKSQQFVRAYKDIKYLMECFPKIPFTDNTMTLLKKEFTRFHDFTGDLASLYSYAKIYAKCDFVGPLPKDLLDQFTLKFTEAKTNNTLLIREINHFEALQKQLLGLVEQQKFIGEKATADSKTFSSSDVIQIMDAYFLESGNKDDGYHSAREKHEINKIPPDVELPTVDSEIRNARSNW